MSGQWWTGIDDLDAQQRRVLELNPSGRYFVTGPAGCGKTNLLLLRARHLEKRKIENYAVLVYNGPLKRFLTSNVGHGIDPRKTHTFVSWMQSQHWSAIGRAPNGLPDDLRERRKFLCEALRAHLIDNDVRGLVDTILVDEIQDYTADEIDMLSMMATNLFLVGDVRQQIYEASPLKRAIDNVIPRDNQIKLVRHYRIGHEICRLADRIAKPAKGHELIFDGCCYKEALLPSSVRHFNKPLAEQIRIANEAISQQLDAYPDEFIGVMCPRNEELRTVSEQLVTWFGQAVLLQASDGDYQDFLPSTPVVCSSLHNGKGLEFRCVHILGADALKRMPRNRELIYTGITRARTALAIYYDEELPSYLVDALNASAPPSPAPPTDSLF